MAVINSDGRNASCHFTGGFRPCKVPEGHNKVIIPICIAGLAGRGISLLSLPSSGGGPCSAAWSGIPLPPSSAHATLSVMLSGSWSSGSPWHALALWDPLRRRSLLTRVRWECSRSWASVGPGAMRVPDAAQVLAPLVLPHPSDMYAVFYECPCWRRYELVSPGQAPELGAVGAQHAAAAVRRPAGLVQPCAIRHRHALVAALVGPPARCVQLSPVNIMDSGIPDFMRLPSSPGRTRGPSRSGRRTPPSPLPARGHRWTRADGSGCSRTR